MTGRRIRHTPSKSKVTSRNSKPNESSRVYFNVLDIGRVISGLLLFNAIISYFITGSTTWGYKGKYLDKRYYAFLIKYPFESHTFTDLELSRYDGSNNGPIYLAINGTVFDVTYKRDLYQPLASYSNSQYTAGGSPGSYHLLAGKDASRVLVTGCLGKLDEYTYDLRGLDDSVCELKINQWFNYYNKNPHYWVVGNVIHDYENLPSDPPSLCLDGTEYPY